MSNALIQLIYVSTAQDGLGEGELLDILATARRVNAGRDITGMLLFGGGNFMQVLEGAAEDVHDIYAAICRDPRHHDVTLITDEPLLGRHFADWQMGFRGLTELEVTPPEGLSDFMEHGGRDRFIEQPSLAASLLEIFRRNSPPGSL